MNRLIVASFVVATLQIASAAGATLVAMMNTHLATTTDEVVAGLTKNWEQDVRAFDAVYTHILAMSDALSDGIVKQFPDRF